MVKLDDWALAFVHIPKAGGTQMSAFLRDLSVGHNHALCYSPAPMNAIKNLLTDRWNHCRLYSAEASMLFWDRLDQRRKARRAATNNPAIGRHLSRFTVLRRPSTLAPSWLNHCQRYGRLRGLTEISRGFDPAACQDSESMACFWQHQRYLAKFLNPASLKLTSARLWTRAALECVPGAVAELRDKAVAALERLAVVVILEAHTSTLCVFYWVYYMDRFDLKCRAEELEATKRRRQPLPAGEKDHTYVYNWTEADAAWAATALAPDQAVYRAGLAIADRHTRAIDATEGTHLNPHFRQSLCAAGIHHLGCPGEEGNRWRGSSRGETKAEALETPATCLFADKIKEPDAELLASNKLHDPALWPRPQR